MQRTQGPMQMAIWCSRTLGHRCTVTLPRLQSRVADSSSARRQSRKSPFSRQRSRNLQHRSVLQPRCLLAASRTLNGSSLAIIVRGNVKPLHPPLHLHLLATAASDQYSLGVMLYECATGVLPFDGSSPYDLMHAIVTSSVRAPSAVRPGIPPALDDVVLRAMHRDPSKRFPSVYALGSALLSMGSKGAWAIWGPEFVIDSHDGSGLEATCADGQATQERETGTSLARPLDAESRRTSRLAFVGALGLLLAFGIAGAFVKARRAPSASSPDVLPESTPALGVAAPATIAAPTDTVLAVVTSQPLAATVQLSASSPSNPLPRTRRVASGSSRPAATSSGARAEPLPPAAPEKGSHNAPILE